MTLPEPIEPSIKQTKPVSLPESSIESPPSKEPFVGPLPSEEPCMVASSPRAQKRKTKAKRIKQTKTVTLPEPSVGPLPSKEPFMLPIEPSIKRKKAVTLPKPSIAPLHSKEPCMIPNNPQRALHGVRHQLNLPPKFRIEEDDEEPYNVKGPYNHILDEVVACLASRLQYSFAEEEEGTVQFLRD